jgi:hypothetical protein
VEADLQRETRVPGYPACRCLFAMWPRRLDWLAWPKSPTLQTSTTQSCASISPYAEPWATWSTRSRTPTTDLAPSALLSTRGLT